MLTIGTRRILGGHGDRDYRYTGVLRDGTTIVAECGHDRANRDQGGDSATDCIRIALRNTALPEAARQYTADRFRNEWQNLTRRGFQHTADTIARAKADSAAKADAYLQLVDELTNLLTTRGLRVDPNGRRCTFIVPAA